MYTEKQVMALTTAWNMELLSIIINSRPCSNTQGLAPASIFCNRNPVIYQRCSCVHILLHVSSQMSSNHIKSETITAVICCSQWMTNTQHATLILSASERTLISAVSFVFLSARPSCWETNSWKIQASTFLTAHFLSDDRIITLVMVLAFFCLFV